MFERTEYTKFQGKRKEPIPSVEIDFLIFVPELKVSALKKSNVLSTQFVPTIMSSISDGNDLFLRQNCKEVSLSDSPNACYRGTVIEEGAT